MKKQLIALGTLFIFALGALPSSAACCNSCCNSCCSCQPLFRTYVCPACPCKMNSCCPAAPIAAPCCNSPCLSCPKPCCDPCAMPCPAAPVKPCVEPKTCDDCCD